MCFVSSDPEIHLKREFELFPVTPNLNKKQLDKIRSKYYYGRHGVNKAITTIKQRATQIDNRTAFVAVSEMPDTNFNAELRINNLCNELSHLISRICVLINGVEYELAEQLLVSSQELFTAINEISSDDDSNARIKSLSDYFAEIRSFLTYLKSIQGHPEKEVETLHSFDSRLSLKFKIYALNNLINKKKLLNIISELKSKDSYNNPNKRAALIKEARLSVSKSFRGGGSSSLRKWARKKLASIDA